MTRQEFIDDVTMWLELIYWCSGQDRYCDVCENVFDEADYNERIDEEIDDWDDGWENLREFLADLPTGYEYYIFDDYDGTYRGADDDDFERLKEEALEWGDDHDVWDNAENEEEGDDPEPEPEPEKTPVAAFDMDGIMNDTHMLLLTYRRRSAEEKAAMERATAEMIGHV